MSAASEKRSYTATTNACKLCTPLGASLVFKGVRGAVPLMHGSQGCATYMRRYLISHFKEPMDIASSNFSEETAVFGGGANLKLSMTNVIRQYRPELLGISTTCLSETIGDDVPMIVKSFLSEAKEEGDVPPIVHVATPSYSGTHMDGFHGAVRALVDQLAEGPGKSELPVLAATPDEADAGDIAGTRDKMEAPGKTGMPGTGTASGSAASKAKTGTRINLLPGMLSTADLRYLKAVIEGFGAEAVVLPDYERSLDGGLWGEYQKIPEGGTSVDEIRSMGGASATIELGDVLAETESAGHLLKERFGIPLHGMGLPMGIRGSDRFFKTLEMITGSKTPERFSRERERLLDALADGHKYVFEARAVLYGEEDFVAGMAAVLAEIGVVPVLCASGGKSRHLERKIRERVSGFCDDGIEVVDGVDFSEIEEKAASVAPDFLIGSSKGYPIARKLSVPLIRAGFPVHDRVGGSRILHVGYGGTQALFDRIANTLLTVRQEKSQVGYSYM